MTNDDQKEFWKSSAGPTWVALQAQMDALMQPVLDLLLEASDLRSGQRVLDIGCGTGASTGQAAACVGPAGHVTGIDISETMLALASARLADQPNIRFLNADAQNHAFEPGGAEALISRFGVMFFEDTVAAFGNMAGALVPGARLTMAAWGPAPENPFFMEPAAAASELLGPMPKVDRTQPGPFAFEDTGAITEKMRAAGLVDITARNVHLALTPEGDLRAVGDLCCQIGPADSALQYHAGQSQERKALSEAIALRFSRYDSPNGVHIPASINLFQARKSA